MNDDRWILLIGISVVLVFVLIGLGIATSREPSLDWQREAIQYGAGRYHPQTGEFEWLEDERLRDCPWYLSAAAVKQYQQIAGMPEEEYGPSFEQAEAELAVLAKAARLSDDEGRRQFYRIKTTIRGKRTRLEFTVIPEAQPEGNLPQLVRVRNKGR